MHAVVHGLPGFLRLARELVKIALDLPQVSAELGGLGLELDDQCAYFAHCCPLGFRLGKHSSTKSSASSCPLARTSAITFNLVSSNSSIGVPTVPNTVLMNRFAVRTFCFFSESSALLTKSNALMIGSSTAVRLVL